MPRNPVHSAEVQIGCWPTPNLPASKLDIDTGLDIDHSITHMDAW